MVLFLPRDAASVPVSRQVLDGCLATLGVTPDTRNDLALALSEACANAIQHSSRGEEYEVTASARDGRCVIEVVNTGPVPAMPGTMPPAGRMTAEPSPVFTTSITHRPSLALAITSYSSPGPACRTTLAHASLSASAMSVRVSAATPRVSRQPSRTWRLTGTLAASRGRNSTILISTPSPPGLARQPACQNAISLAGRFLTARAD